MGLVPRFKPDFVQKELNKGQALIEKQMITVFKFIGEEFAKNAKARVTETIYERTVFDSSGNPRTRKAWELTGNLRSSIGYFVLKDGIIIDEKFSGNSEGIDAAKEMLGEVEKGGIQLVGVAGMNYASYVESKGYDVISTSKDVAIVNLKKDVKRLQSQINKHGYGVSFQTSSMVL
jgi:hypothetical protein